MAPYLKFYAIYAQNFERAMATLGAWTSKSSELRDFKEQQFRRPESESVTLEGELDRQAERQGRAERQLYVVIYIYVCVSPRRAFSFCNSLSLGGCQPAREQARYPRGWVN